MATPSPAPAAPAAPMTAATVSAPQPCATWSVYIDGSALPNPGRMRIGGIAHAPDGSIYTFSQAVGHTGCNNEAEALAATHALQWLHGLGARYAVLHTDSSILVEQLRPHPKPIARLAAIYDHARRALALLDQVELRWIPRHKNAVADGLARGDAAQAS